MGTLALLLACFFFFSLLSPLGLFQGDCTEEASVLQVVAMGFWRPKTGVGACH